NVDRQSLRRPFALLFTADEEIGLIGAKRFSALKPLKAKFALVGEPTSLQPIRGGKGYCLAEITVGGREAHSAYPALGTSAINGASRLISRIEQIATNMQSEARQDFDPPFTTLNIGLIQGGTAKNVIPGRCSFTLEWRPIPGQDANFLLTKIEAAVAEEAARDPNLTFKIDASRADAGFETSAHSRLVTLMKNLTGRASGTVAFGTEAAQMAELGAEAVVFGPGNIRDAHRTGEFVPVAELERCAEILTAAIDAFCVA
ncbi:MAG TPA: M20/M25/M40 family metallo-hydrolase, partial [Pyrinomonadaceae bacterium]|nr:M20/M25/M40 family metallo-hydrolase [Pyrinomonadaceae bacterium]